MEAAATVGLPMTATIMYGHVENDASRPASRHHSRPAGQDGEHHRIRAVVVHFEQTPLAEHGVVEIGAGTDEDELMIAVSRLFLDNIENIQSSWVKYGDAQG